MNTRYNDAASKKGKNIMRIRVLAHLDKSISIPINHQYALTGVIYNFLKNADIDYASFLHQEGYRGSAETDSRRFKLFCFSTLRSRRRKIHGASLWLGPGEIEWLVTSPVEKFLQEFASGLLNAGELRIGSATLPLSNVETLQRRTFGNKAAFTCLTPIVCSVSDNEHAHARYLTPQDAEFSEAVRHNLIRKFIALHGHPPQEENLKLQWDADYLQRNRGTKLVEYKSTFIKGAFAPFCVEGSVELIELLYEAGAGEKNSGGFGMVEVKEK